MVTIFIGIVVVTLSFSGGTEAIEEEPVNAPDTATIAQPAPTESPTTTLSETTTNSEAASVDGEPPSSNPTTSSVVEELETEASPNASNDDGDTASELSSTTTSDPPAPETIGETTAPPATQPPVTQPQPTAPPATQPPVTAPPTTSFSGFVEVRCSGANSCGEQRANSSFAPAIGAELAITSTSPVLVSAQIAGQKFAFQPGETISMQWPGGVFFMLVADTPEGITRFNIEWEESNVTTT